MTRARRKYDKEFKAKLVLAILKGEQSLQELSRQYDISPTVLARWRDKFIEAGMAGFAEEGAGASNNGQVQMLQKEIEERDRVIGELTVANKALKKNIYGT